MFRDEIKGFESVGERVNAFHITTRVAKWLSSFGKQIAGNVFATRVVSVFIFLLVIS